jgi:hypothetical protein
MADASRGTGRPLRAVRWLWVGAPEALATCAPEHAPRFNVD